MNILILSKTSNYYSQNYGGAEISLRLFAEKLSQINQNVYFLTNAGKTKKIPYLSVVSINGVKVIAFKPIRWPGFKNRLFPKMRERFDSYQFQQVLRYLARAQKIDIVYTYATLYNAYDALMAKEKYGLKYKVVLRIAGFHWLKMILADRQKKESIEWVFKKTDVLNFLSKSNKDLFMLGLKQVGISAVQRKYFILDIGYNNLAFKSRWNYIEKPRFVITMIARFVSKKKRQDLLLQAFKTLEDKYELHFIGNGPGLNTCISYAKENRLEHVFFHGQVPQSQVKCFLEKSSLAVLLSEYEGVSKSVLEAMSLGVPVLASDIPAFAEIIQDGVNGFLTANNKDKIVEKIESIFNMKGKVVSVSENEIAFVKKYYDPDKNIRKYQRAFLRLCLR